MIRQSISGQYTGRGIGSTRHKSDNLQNDKPCIHSWDVPGNSDSDTFGLILGRITFREFGPDCQKRANLILPHESCLIMLYIPGRFHSVAFSVASWVIIEYNSDT